MPAFENLLVDYKNDIATITINRPKALNALNQDLLLELYQAITEIKANLPSALVITGAGDKAFVAGADISQLATLSPRQAQEFSILGHNAFRALEDLPIPVIAAVNGFALGGGCELALSCDFIIASTKAKFGQPEVKLGLIPGFGGCIRLGRKIPSGAARYLTYTGDIINAQKAYELGLVYEICEPEQLMDTVYSIAHTIAKQAPLAVQTAKKVIDQALDTDFNAACSIEQQAFSLLLDTQDAKEGTQAFLEKREPQFSKA